MEKETKVVQEKLANLKGRALLYNRKLIGGESCVNGDRKVLAKTDFLFIHDDGHKSE